MYLVVHVHLIRQTQRRGDRGAGHQPAMAASVLGGDGRAARPARSTSVRMAHSSRGTDLHDGPRRLAARRGRPAWETLGRHLVTGCWTNRHVERGNEAYYFGSRRTNEERPESFPTVPYSLRNSHWKAVSTFRPFAGSPRPEPEPIVFFSLSDSISLLTRLTGIHHISYCITIIMPCDCKRKRHHDISRQRRREHVARRTPAPHLAPISTGNVKSHTNTHRSDHPSIISHLI